MLPLRNIGPTSAEWLAAIGVESRGDLEELGAVEAFLRVKDAGFSPSVNLLYALEGALQDLHWAELPIPVREELRREALATEQARGSGVFEAAAGAD